MKKAIIIGISVLVGVLVFCAILIGIGYNKYMTIETERIDPQVTVYTSGGGNSLVLESKTGDSALIIDTKMGRAAGKMRRKVGARDIIVVNTHAHRDHTGGNKLYPGAHVVSGGYTRDQWKNLSGGIRFPDETVMAGDTKIIKIGGETVYIRNLGAAHTYNDLIVFLENRKLLMVGDIVFLNMHPALFPEKGTVILRWIAALDTISRGYDARTVVPGHGPVSTMAAVKNMHDYFVSIRDALGNENRLAALKEQYKGYYALPGMSSFEITVNIITKELKP
jgi:glyoxylase-like metal-dependent hydrolase (beta-lactamase superfamily II)